MRTKTLLLTAAVFAAGIGASLAQVYSVNAVGYVNVTLATRYNLVSNPLNGTNNNLNTIIPVAPGDSTVLRWNPAGQTFGSIDTYIDAGDPAINGWYDATEVKTSTTLAPGEAFFLYNAGAAGTVLTFVGEVPQGNLTNVLSARYGFYSSVVPQAAGLSVMGFPSAQDMTYTSWDPAGQTYVNTLTYIDDADPAVRGWYTAGEVKVDPVPPIGGGFLLYSPHASSVNWTRSFSVNN